MVSINIETEMLGRIVADGIKLQALLRSWLNAKAYGDFDPMAGVDVTLVQTAI